MTNVGDTGHTANGHNDWEARVTAQAARFGVTPPAFGGPYPIGAPDHIAVHNTYADAIRPILTAAGVEATLPDTANVGDLGHVADHDLLFAAVEALEALTTPDAPTLVTADAIPAGVRLTWSPPAVDGGYPILGYRMEWRETGATEWTRVTPDTAADASTGDAMTGKVGTFEVRVKAVNRLGAGHPSTVLEATVTTAFNDATGGTVTEVDNYNETGRKYRIHTFRENGTFVVSTSVDPCAIAIVGGGAPSSRNGTVRTGRSGGGGKGETWTETLAVGSYPITVGAAIGGADLTDPPGGNGTSAFGRSAGGGNACSAGNHDGGGGWNQTLTIDGTGPQGYGRDGAGGSGATSTKYGGGGGWSTVTNAWGVGGDAGAVIIAYPIG